jgi:hypothetical protein
MILLEQRFQAKKGGKSYPCNRPWRRIDFWDVEAHTFSRQSAHRWLWGQPYQQCHLLPCSRSYRLASVPLTTNLIAPTALLITSRHGPHRKHLTSVAVSSCRAECLFVMPLLSNDCCITFFSRSLLSNGSNAKIYCENARDFKCRLVEKRGFALILQGLWFPDVTRRPMGREELVAYIELAFCKGNWRLYFVYVMILLTAYCACISVNWWKCRRINTEFSMRARKQTAAYDLKSSVCHYGVGVQRFRDCLRDSSSFKICWVIGFP